MTNHFAKPITGRGGGGKGGGSRSPTEAPNSLRSRSTARVIDLVSEGPIVGLVDGLKSVFFNDTALQNADGSFNFQNVSIETRDGEPDQDPLAGFPAIEAENAVGTEVLFGTPVVRTVTNADVDAVRFTIRIPSLMDVNTETGDITATSVQVRFEAKPDGGAWQTLRTATISGKTNSPYERAYRLALPGAGPWEIRTSRLTADSTKTDLQNKTIWSSYTEIIDHKLIYPDSAVIGVTVDAEAFGGSVPKRAYELYGRVIEVPSNYAPETRAYSGVWDGTFKSAWADNPAWVFRDIIVHNRYGAGEFIDASQVDKWQLYSIAQYCDGLVPDGFGGTEPRFTFNAQIVEREQAIRVITALAGVFRGMAHWGSGAIFASADMPADPVKLVTPANIVGDFNYEGTSLKSRHSVALVSWANPAIGYEPDIEVVEDAELIAKYGYRPLEVTAVGCTVRGQAARYGKWALDSEKHESEVVNYQASFDHADLAPGDIISIADPNYAGARLGGRMASINGALDAVTIDAAITLEAGETYQLMIVMADQAIETRDLTNGASSTAVLTLDGALSAAPVTGALWIVSASDVAPRNFRVIAITEAEKNLFSISAVFHDPDKYDRIELGLTLEAPDYTSIPSGPLPAPTNPSFIEYLYLASGTTPRSAVTFSWSAPNDARVSFYQVQVKKPGLEWEPAGATSGLSLDVSDLSSGVHGFQVRAIGALGREGPWLTVDGVYLNGLMALPGDVQNFRVSIVNDMAMLKWEPVAAVNLSHYVIRFTPDLIGASWGSSSVILSDVAGTSVQVLAQVGTYLIKAVTMQGISSANATLVSSNVSPLNAVNVVEILAQDPAFSGVKVSTFAAGGILRLDGDGDVMADWNTLADVPLLAYGGTGAALSGQYYFDQVIDLSEVYTSRLTSDFHVTGEDILNTMSTWNTLAEVMSLAGTTVDEWGFVLEVSTTNDDPAGAPAWTDWAPFAIGDYDARAFRFRALLTAATAWVTPAVDRLRITVDMPDRVVAGDDIVVPVAGLRVDFTPAFKSLNGVSVSAQGLATGDYYALTNKDATGFDIRFFDSTDAAVSRTLDFVGKGYGRINTWRKKTSAR